MTTLVLTNTALFSYHCAIGQLRMASFHPPLVYTSVIAFFLLPANFIFKVHSFESHHEGRVQTVHCNTYD